MLNAPERSIFGREKRISRSGENSTAVRYKASVAVPAFRRIVLID
jgi:hypothetical protein